MYFCVAGRETIWRKRNLMFYWTVRPTLSINLLQRVHYKGSVSLANTLPRSSLDYVFPVAGSGALSASGQSFFQTG